MNASKKAGLGVQGGICEINGVKAKFGDKVWVFVSAYSPGSEKSDYEKENFRSQLTRTVEEWKRGGSHVVVLGDLNAKIGNEAVDGVIDKYGRLERNVRGERLLKMCSEMEMVIGNTYVL